MSVRVGEPLLALVEVDSRRRAVRREYEAALHAAVAAGHSAAEIAEVLGISRQAVSAYLRRGLGDPGDARSLHGHGGGGCERC